MAEMGMVPAVWGRKSRHDTPTHAIVLATVLIIGMSLASTFEEIVTTTNFLYRCVVAASARPLVRSSLTTTTCVLYSC